MMIFDPAKILCSRIRMGHLALLFFLTIYVIFSFWIFFSWVAPSLDGHIDMRIAADSSTYLYFADTLREGRPDPEVYAALATFPNTLWLPVFLAFVLKSTFAIAIANYAMFFIAIFLLNRTFSISLGIFVALLLLNATTTISLLSVNKEIVDLLVVSIFFFARKKESWILIILSLLLALFNRYEVCLVLMLYLATASKINFWRRRRGATLVGLMIALSIVLPLFASQTLEAHFMEASSSTTVTFLDILEMHYLFAISVIPKVAENFFAELINVSKWTTAYGLTDIANSYILLSNNLAMLIVFFILFKKRAFTLKSDLIYFASLGCVIMAISLVIQPRYFYFIYVVLCIQAALPKSHRISGGTLDITQLLRAANV